MRVKREDVIGKTNSEVCGDEYHKQVQSIDERIWKGETVKTLHKISRQGVERDYELLRFPIRDMDGKIVFIAGLIREAFIPPLRIEKKMEDFPSLAIKRMFSKIKVALGVSGAIFLLGEKGTGKSRIARHIHMLSGASGPMYSVNCAIMDDNILIGEVFGINDSAPSNVGAGLIELAESGTLLIENIQYSGIDFQEKVLLFLKEGKYTKYYGKQERRANVRIVVCEDENLFPFVLGGRFNQELYYLLTIMVVQVPPLRERKEDIPLLVKSISDELQKEITGSPCCVTKEAIDVLADYSWPGNVRELKNVIERSLMLAKGQNIEIRHLSLRATDSISNQVNEKFNLTLEEVVDKAVIFAVRNALQQNNGNQVRAAKALNISRDTIRRHINKFGIVAKSPQ
jgi:DNA-binding NtrC family response regulator